jgi:hypothetical protein
VVRSALRRVRRYTALAWVLVPLLSGCSASMIHINPPDASTATVDVTIIRADTAEPIDVGATVVIGGETATLAAGDQTVRVSGVPFGSDDPPTQPLTVNAEDFVTYFTNLELSRGAVTQAEVQLDVADPTLTGTVTGKVTNEDDDTPIGNVILEFKPDIPGTPEGITCATDKAGQYTARGILTGATVVTATAVGFLGATEKLVVVQDSGGTGTPPLDLQLVPTSTKVNVSGRVIDLITRDPIKDASVDMGGVGPELTDANGRFQLLEVPVGDQTIHVTATDYDPYTDTVSVAPGMASLQVELAASQDRPPTWPSTISGTVTIRNNPDNAGATVKAIDGSSGQVIDTTVTNAAGEYGLFVPPGTYRIEVSFEGVTISKSVTLGGAGRTRTGVDFQITAP